MNFTTFAFMKQVDVLIQLVKSLSKAEKRVFRISSKEDADYMLLFNLIDKEQIDDASELKKEYTKRNYAGAFNVTVLYLYKLLLEKLIALRSGSTNSFILIAECQKAQVLFEKSMYEAALEILRKVKKRARELENFEILLMVSRIELDYLQYLKMPDMTEEDLNRMHADLSDTLAKVTYLNEQSKLYETIEHKLIYIGNARSDRHASDYDDLLKADSLLLERFPSDQSKESRRRHLLFQALYYTAKGNGTKALEILSKLNELIKANPHLAENPLYYIRFIHNMLDNLRDAGEYDKMPEFIESLRSKDYHSQYITDHVMAITDLYQLIIYLDHGDFQRADDFIKRSNSFDIAGTQRLHVAFEARILLYIALTHIGMKNYRAARHTLSKSKFSSSLALEFPIFRTVRLTNLIVHYKLNDTDYISAQARSLKREMTRKSSSFSLELLLMKVMLKGTSGLVSRRQREKMWNEIEPQLESIKADPFESQSLYLFDFAAWLESEITRKPLSEIIKRRFAE